MSKIIYLNQEVKLGEVITYQGLEVEVTQTLIDNNPDTFKVIDERQELLDKAKRDYLVGTVFMNFFGKICTVKNEPCYSLGAYSSILIDGIYVYRDGRWAEVLPLKFTTEDGVSIYGDMKTYMVYSNLTMSNKNINNEGTNNAIKYFYHKENALAYIEKHREKTLEDYENILFERGNSMIFSSGTMYFSVYGWLKDNEPKLYYTKILQLIADDLNDGWVADFIDNKDKWIIKEDNSEWTKHRNYGAVSFKTKELSEKARNILGDKVKYLFN